jgi:hypothetical protein
MAIRLSDQLVNVLREPFELDVDSPQADGLVAWLPLPDYAFSAYEYLTNQSVLWQLPANHVGSASPDGLQFQGGYNGECLAVPLPGNIAQIIPDGQARTIAYWVGPQVAAGDGCLISAGRIGATPWYSEFHQGDATADTFVATFAYNNNFDNSSTINSFGANGYHWIVSVTTATTHRLYVDGKLRSNKSHSMGNVSRIDVFWLNRRVADNQTGFGSFRDVRLYNREVSEAEVAEWYAKGTDRIARPLLGGHWATTAEAVFHDISVRIGGRSIVAPIASILSPMRVRIGGRSTPAVDLPSVSVVAPQGVRITAGVRLAQGGGGSEPAEYDVGDAVELFARFDTAIDSEPVDPPIVRCKIMNRRGEMSTYVYGGEDEVLQRSEAGEYFLKLNLLTWGLMAYRWESEDSGPDNRTGAEEGEFEVRWSAFEDGAGNPVGSGGGIDGGTP